eukprot:TRINITY_DN1530_c0_g2_i1.p1 TRINITY_DN1530_c0_g2~~TRINITY_DN1530_c0_g2_i1.p1  ORF type:complete len:1295 (+),score=291.04 TRINITY_DN1530_c0_g2_i1:37-3921(+)
MSASNTPLARRRPSSTSPGDDVVWKSSPAKRRLTSVQKTATINLDEQITSFTGAFAKRNADRVPLAPRENALARWLQPQKTSEAASATSTLPAVPAAIEPNARSKRGLTRVLRKIRQTEVPNAAPAKSVRSPFAVKSVGEKKNLSLESPTLGRSVSAPVTLTSEFDDMDEEFSAELDLLLAAASDSMSGISAASLPPVVAPSTSAPNPSSLSLNEFDDFDFSEELESLMQTAERSTSRNCNTPAAPDSAPSAFGRMQSKGSDIEDLARVKSSIPTSDACPSLRGIPVASRLVVQSVTSTPGSIDKTITLQNAQKVQLQVVLQGSWTQLDVRVGDTANVLDGSLPDLASLSDGACVLPPVICHDFSRNLFVLHPDVLVSGTRIAGSFTCLRRTVLEENVRMGSNNASALYGSLLHELFEETVLSGDSSSAAMEERITTLLRDHMDSIYATCEGQAAAVLHLKEMAPQIQSWAQRFMSATTPLMERLIQLDGATARTALRINRVIGVEENIWSPTLGVKGVIDIPVVAETEEMAQSPAGARSANTRQVASVPLELKTGRQQGGSYPTAHRAQLVLYMLLMSERYDFNVDMGLLCYLRSGKMFGVRTTWSELRSIMIGRNLLAAHLVPRQSLPPLLQNQTQTCNRCNMQEVCFVFHKTVENGSAETSGLGSLFERKTGSITSQQKEYFTLWMSLIELESESVLKQRQEIWTKSSEHREKTGRCFGDMELQAQQAVGRLWLATFRKRASVLSSSLLEAQFNVGDNVLCIAEGSALGVNPGYLRTITATELTVEVSAEIHIPRSNADSILWRVEKNELASSFSAMRENIVRLFVATDADVITRQRVVDLCPPRFAAPPSSLAGICDEKLNADQEDAIKKCLAAEDYALILGMPGTGKTTTIVRVVVGLVRSGKTVLITSSTHAAVDNILLKLHEEQVDFLRIGRASQVHPVLQKYVLDYNDERLQSADDLDDLIRSKNIIATTCLGINHPLLSKRKFDICIVDEAGQIIQAVCLGPLRMARRFVLVGDHYQLQPVVRSREAAEAGMSVSLFRRLCEAHPAAVCNLSFQYRMNSDIMLLSNTLVYSNMLKCGNSEVARSELSLPNPSAVDVSESASGCAWLHDVLLPTRKVVFLDTELVPARETRQGDAVSNEVEAVLVQRVVAALVRCGISPTDIGVIAPYRAQMQRIRQKLQRSDIDVHTVDRYQGRDKDCMIVSLVRSNDSCNVGDLLKDWRRINVAFTRAKKKLIVVGSATTLAGSEVCLNFIELLRKQQWVYPLPPHAHEITNMPSQIVTQHRFT